MRETPSMQRVSEQARWCVLRGECKPACGNRREAHLRQRAGRQLPPAQQQPSHRIIERQITITGTGANKVGMCHMPGCHRWWEHDSCNSCKIVLSLVCVCVHLVFGYVWPQNGNKTKTNSHFQHACTTRRCNSENLVDHPFCTWTHTAAHARPSPAELFQAEGWTLKSNSLGLEKNGTKVHKICNFLAPVVSHAARDLPYDEVFPRATSRQRQFSEIRTTARGQIRSLAFVLTLFISKAPNYMLARTLYRKGVCMYRLLDWG